MLKVNPGILFLYFLLACGPGQGDTNVETATPQKKNYPLAIDHDKFYTKDGHQYLYGGEKPGEDFDISNLSLKDDQFHFGIGRERFPALLKPRFMDMKSADTLFDDSIRFLLLDFHGVLRAYSIRDLTHHEVVNDEVDGIPIMAAYCVLADLGAIYDRRMLHRPFTFALSGYTYYDPDVWDGMDGFVLWDRETESLWWPLIGEAVSGKMKGTKLKVLDEKHWSQTTWGEIKEHYDNVDVLIPDQDFDRPANWRHYTDIHILTDSTQSIAPRWGENSR